MDVIQRLKKDHKMVKKMFAEFEHLHGRHAAQKKPALVAQICQALTVHTQVEEELVYPVFKEHRAMNDLVCEAAEEHAVAKRLVSELDTFQPDEERYDAKVKVLGEYVLHHVKEEEKGLFPQAEKQLSTRRLEALGEQVEARRSELKDDRDEPALKARAKGRADRVAIDEEDGEAEGVKGNELRRQRGGRRAA
jgi:hemerythrin superfamily protein